MPFFNLFPFLAALIPNVTQQSDLGWRQSLAVQTDQAIFLFDQGETNFVASMIDFAEINDRVTLNNLDFKIVFMGSAIDAMEKEPFCRFQDKLINYRSLGISESIDREWKRDGKLSKESLALLQQNLHVKKQIWAGVSCSAFAQILEQAETSTLALRDNPNPQGDSDYFKIAEEVQNCADSLAIPSQAVKEHLYPNQSDKPVFIVGHPPLEEWQNDAEHLDKNEIIDRLKIDPTRPIIVFTGSYGERYEHALSLFIQTINHSACIALNPQVFIIPHPRFKGSIEKTFFKNVEAKLIPFIASEFEIDPHRSLKTIEALVIADLVVTADPTSTVVFQANALKKHVLLFQIQPNEISQKLCDHKILYRITNGHELAEEMIQSQKVKNASTQDIFSLMGIPKNGAKLLWEQFVK